MNPSPSFQLRRRGWGRLTIVATALVATALGVAAGCAPGAPPRAAGLEHDHHAQHVGHGAPPPADGANPVQGEMRVLTEALATAPASFGAGDIRPLEHRLHAVHAAKEKTVAAIANGSYRPPRNAGDLARFEQLDREFHATLEALAEHAANNELAPAARAYGQVLAACNGCHSEFASPH